MHESMSGGRVKVVFDLTGCWSYSLILVFTYVSSAFPVYITVRMNSRQFSMHSGVISIDDQRSEIRLILPLSKDRLKGVNFPSR